MSVSLITPRCEHGWFLLRWSHTYVRIYVYVCMYVYIYIYIYIYTCICAKQKHLEYKKVRGQEEAAL